MYIKKITTLAAIILSVGSADLFAQGIDKILSAGEVHGNFGLDIQYYQEDSLIGANAVSEDVLMNAFANFIYTNGNFSAGFRYESYLNALQGFPTQYKGNGIGYKFASYTNDNMSVTVGNYYEQFGNGLIFRTYEALSGLGYDNSMEGVRVTYN